jgi:hypothetical protein
MGNKLRAVDELRPLGVPVQASLRHGKGIEMKRKACVWVVEEWWTARVGWHPNWAHERTRKAAREAKRKRRAYFGKGYPPKLRVVKYVRAGRG